MKPWHIFYDDGTVFTNTQTHSLDVPHEGVVCIVQERPDGRNESWFEKDFYIYIDGGWIGVDIHGLVSHTKRKLDKIERVLEGVTLSSTRYWQIREKAKQYI